MQTTSITEFRPQSLFAMIDQGFCMVEVRFDAANNPLDYRFVEVNSLFEQQTGLVGATGKWMRELRPEHEEYWFQVYGKVALTGEPARFENRAAALDDRWFDVYAFRVGEPEKRQVAILFRDISARKHAEEAMRASKAQLQTLFEAAPLGIYLVDANLRICQVNPAAMPVFGDLPDLIGRDFAEVIHQLWPQAYADDVIVRFRHTLATGEPYFVPERIEERRDRKMKEYYEWQINRITLPDNSFGVVCYFRDISAQVQARSALTEMDRQKDRFIATLSHELRNPLASINSAASLMQFPELDAASQKWAAQVIMRQSHAMAALLDDLLDVSRLTLGRFELHKQNVPLAQVLEAALETTRAAIEEAGHRLSIAMPPSTVTIDADALRLSQAIANLLTNAAKYTDRGGEIALEASVLSNEVVVSVSDNGIGIEPGNMDKLFEMFAQGPSARERSPGGLGIGLALVEDIVHRHGGRVQAESEGPGRGSRFSLILPQTINAARAGAAELQHAAPPQATERHRILIVDDNADAAESLAMLLQFAGHDTRVAIDGNAALEETERFAPHVIVLDIGMPGLNGYEVARRIRQMPCGREITLFAATGWGQEKDRQLTQEAGFDLHFTKPLDTVELEASIAEHLGRRSR
jgi:PAS domain S-box-containing protein